jgi:hypothetical protein
MPTMRDSNADMLSARIRHFQCRIGAGFVAIRVYVKHCGVWLYEFVILLTSGGWDSVNFAVNFRCARRYGILLTELLRLACTISFEVARISRIRRTIRQSSNAYSNERYRKNWVLELKSDIVIVCDVAQCADEFGVRR